MDSLKWNKIAAGVLLALLALLIGGLLSEIVLKSPKLEKESYPIEGLKDNIAQEETVKEEKVEPISDLLATANVEKGKEIALRCLQCHSFNKGEAHKTGPNLWGVLGMHIMHVVDYAYSAAFKAFSERDKKWDYEVLNAYLYAPAKYVPGTKMSFIGLKKPQERADLIAYLRTLSDNPLPLPVKK